MTKLWPFEVFKSFQVQNSSIRIQNSKFKPQNGLSGKFPTQDQVDLVLGRKFPAQSVLGFEFEIWIRILSCFWTWKIPETSKGHNLVIRTPIFENSDSFPSRISGWTKWWNPLPLILILKINSALIYSYNTLSKYGVLQTTISSNSHLEGNRKSG